MAVRFDASGDAYTRAATGLGSTNLTFCCWVYISTDRNANTYYLGGDDQSDYTLLGFQSDGTTIEATSTGGFIAGASLSTGTWYFTALTYDSGGTDTLYYGAATAADLTTATGSLSGLTDAVTFFIGNNAFSEFLNGRVAAVKVFTAALTAAEIEAERWFYTPQRTANLWGWYPLIETDTVDWSGNGRTLTVNGTLATEDPPPISWAPQHTRLRPPTTSSSSGNPTLADFTSSATGTVVVTDPWVVVSGGAAVADRSPSITFSSYTPLENDVVVFFPSSTTTATITIPATWVNPLGGTTDVESDAHQICVVYHKVTAAEQSSATTTYTATNLYDATETGYVQGAVIRNVDPNDVVDAIGSTFDSTNTVTPHVLAGITGTGSALKDNSLVVSSVAKDATGDYGASAPTGWTRLRNDNTNQGRWIGYRNALTTANTNVTATNITPSAGDEYASISVAFTKVGVLGTAAPTLADFTGAASGTETISGTSAQTLENFTSTATGWATATGTSAQTLENATSSAFGTVGDVINGNVAVTLADATSSATGTEVFTGTSAQTLANFTSSATGTETITGTATPTLAAFTSSASGVMATGRFVASVSGNGRYLLDQVNEPIICNGLSPQVIQKLSLADMDDLIAAASGIGHNAFLSIGSVIDCCGVNTSGHNVNGDPPWPNPGTSNSITTPDDDYWDHIEAFVDKCSGEGITVFLNLLDNITWSLIGNIGSESVADCFTFGQAMGNRFKAKPNIVWSWGVDWGTSAWTALNPVYGSMMAGIRDAGDTHLMTLWLDPDIYSTENTAWDGTTSHSGHIWPRPDINFVYTYFSSEMEVKKAYQDEAIPCSLFETHYWAERNENTDGVTDTTAKAMRKQYGRSFTYGGLVGGFPSSHEIWLCNTNFVDDLTGTPVFTHIANLFTHIAGLDGWHLLEPDYDQSFITSGNDAEPTIGARDADTHDYITASVSSDGMLALLYVTEGTFTVDLTEISGTARHYWFDPTDGSSTSLTTGQPTYPGNNSDGDPDWLLVFVGNQDATGTAAPTLANFTSTASGAETITGTSAQTLANATAAASGIVAPPVSGTVAVTLAAFTSSASGTETISGTASPTLAGFTSSVTGSEIFTGTSAQTLADFTAAASGIVAPPVSGTVAVTLADFTGAAAGTETITGTSAQTLASATSSASGTETISGTSAQTLADFTGSAAGTETITGTGIPTLADLTSTASGTVTNPGSNGAAVLDDLTSNATGSIGITGSVAVTLAAFTSAASGAETITGTGASTLANATGSATGTETITGSAAPTLANFTSSASGSEGITGTAAPTLAPFTTTASGTPIYTGTTSVAIQDITASAIGVVAFGGFSAQTLANFTSSASGNVGTNSSAAITLADFTASAAGTVILNVTGTCAVTLQNFTCFAFQQSLALSPFTIIETVYLDLDASETIYLAL